MTSPCQFLRPDERGGEPRCAAGVNFSALGADRALCRLCPLASPTGQALCEQADVYLTLVKDTAGVPMIEAQVWCTLEAGARASQRRCANCPARLGVVRLAGGAGASPSSLRKVGTEAHADGN